MDGFFTYPFKGLGAEGVLLEGSFRCNGTADPDPTLFSGPPGLKFTVKGPTSSGAAGVFIVKLPEGLSFPQQPSGVMISRSFATLSDWFDAALLGTPSMNLTTREIQIQAHRAGTANAPANTAGNRIYWALLARNSSGR